MSRYADRPGLKAIRRDLRHHATVAERVLWRMIRRRQLAGRRFRRQHSVGAFVLDFYCPDERLAVEVDGSAHDGPARAEADGRRQEQLEALGIRVVRLRNEEVLAMPDIALDRIAHAFRDERQATRQRTRSPPPGQGELEGGDAPDRQRSQRPRAPGATADRNRPP